MFLRIHISNDDNLSKILCGLCPVFHTTSKNKQPEYLIIIMPQKTIKTTSRVMKILDTSAYKHITQMNFDSFLQRKKLESGLQKGSTIWNVPINVSFRHHNSYNIATAHQFFFPI